jgi:hypothetical protein
MGRLVVWLLVIGLVAGGVQYAASHRYEYFKDGSAQTRRDRWTGKVEVWACVSQFRGTDTPYFPMAGDPQDKSCALFGWTAQ